MNNIRLIDTHKFDFLSGYAYSKVQYKNQLRRVVTHENKRVVTKISDDLVQYSLFQILADIMQLDWFSTLVDTLENDYYLNVSGDKFISIYFKRLLSLYQDDIKFYDNYIFVPEKVYFHLANTISDRFKHKWNELYLLMYNKYNPIHNYSMEYLEKNSKKETKEYDLNNSNSGSDNRSGNGKDYNFGFNSTSKSQTGESESSDTINYGRNEAKTGTETISSNADDNIKTIERSGNIGVKTTQSMMKEEIEVRQYSIVKQIFEDIDLILTSALY